MFRKKLIENPLYYWEEKSYMMIIPKVFDENILKTGIAALEASKEFTIKDTKYEIDGTVSLKVIYDHDLYEVGIYLGGISVPAYYLEKNFLFTEEEKRAF